MEEKTNNEFNEGFPYCWEDDSTKIIISDK
jgi:hypothetical protein